jgi:hypothetical protein
MTSPNVLLTYYTYNTSNKKNSSFLKLIIKNTKECHFDTIFEYDLHLVVYYIK